MIQWDPRQDFHSFAKMFETESKKRCLRRQPEQGLKASTSELWLGLRVFVG